MGLIKDDLGLEVEESILQKVQDPQFEETSKVLDYWSRRKAKEQANKEQAEQLASEEAAKKNKMFGLF